MPYEGPSAAIATLGGSPTWGLGDRFHELAAEQGHARLGVHRPRTPYGLGPQVEHYRAPGGREFLRIPTYGQVVGEDPLLRASEWKTFWILWRAGVRVLLVGGTSGSCDWRRSASDEDAVRPGDLVLPRSYLPRDTMPTGLPGTELEFCLARQVAIMDDPFCPALAGAIREEAHRVPGFRFRRVHGPEEDVVLNRWLAGNGFESLASCRELELYGRLTGMPVITGDCVSPVLARVCGMHLGYYHVVANWGTGLEPDDPTITLDRLYLETLPRVAATLELALLGRLDEPTAVPLPGAPALSPPGVRAGVLPPAVRARRLGLLLPSSGTVQEVDFYRRVPSHVTVHAARMRLPATTAADEVRMLDAHVLPAAADLATIRPDVVVFSCTSAGALRGRDYEARLCEEIAAAANAPVVSTMHAVRGELARLGLRSVAVVTPYPEALTGPIRAGLEADGLAVPVASGLGLTDSLEIAAVPPEAIARFAVETFRQGPADAVFVACCTFRAFDARDTIAAALGVPVVTSNQAALDAALRVLDGKRG